MKKQEFQAVLLKHQLWLNAAIGGKCADLSGADLRGADLSGANMRDAYLSGANMRDANMRGANMRDADLSGADLSDAYLSGANMRDANMRDANMRDAYLRGANMSGANLSGAYLRGADLRGADLRGAKLPPFQICPEVGAFYAWKKTTKGVIKIQIPAKAKRTSSIVGRKCRAEYIKVITCGGTSPTQGNLDYSHKGSIVKANSYDDDIRIECTNGIHFFM